MERFKEYLERKRNTGLIILLFDPSDTIAQGFAETIIEEGKTYQLDNRYSARYDRAQQPNQKNHSHIYLKGNEVCVVNTDGTPSHGSSPMSELPRSIQDKIRHLNLVTEQAMLLETAGGGLTCLLPQRILTLLKLRLLDTLEPKPL